MFGSYGKLLLIDMTKSDIIEKELEKDLLKQYLGGKGLGIYLLLKMLSPGTEPLSPQNMLIITTGPATDTLLAPASRFGIFSKSPVTGFFAESYGGGSIPAQIKRTGYDAVVITGAADKPTFISISEEAVNFFDAAGIWGQESSVAEKAILNAVGSGGSQALVIGPAGEKKVSGASIRNNRWGCSGEAGLGTVMGSKNLKGIVFKGSAKAHPADEKGLKSWNGSLLKSYQNLTGLTSECCPESSQAVTDPVSPGYDPSLLSRNNPVSSKINFEVCNEKPHISIDYEDRLNIFDSLIFCHRYIGLVQWEKLILLLYLLTGVRYSMAELHMVAGCIQNLIRLFNLREGAAGDDVTFSEHLIKESIYKGKGLEAREDLDRMLEEYYLLRGWDEKGIPPLGNNSFEITRRNSNVCGSGK